MREGLDEPVSVIFSYDATRRHVSLYQLRWQGRDYRLGAIDFWHKTRRGDSLIHHFSVGDAARTTYFKLAFDTATLHWTLEEYMTADQMEMHYAA